MSQILDTYPSTLRDGRPVTVEMCVVPFSNALSAVVLRELRLPDGPLAGRRISSHQTAEWSREEAEWAPASLRAAGKL